MVQQSTPQGRRIYLNVKDGRIVRRTEQGEEYYAFVEGKLENIYTKERSFRNETVIYWYIDLRDEQSGELYALGFPYTNNVFKSIALQLPTAAGYDAIRIEPYSKGGYDKVQVYASGTKLDWVTTKLPPLKEVVIGGRVIKDDTERMNLIYKCVKDTLGKIGKQVNK